MAYRDYQKLVHDLLRKQIARKKRLRKREELRKTIDSIREHQKVINKYYTDYPYCNTCGSRQPKEHKCNGNK